MPCGIEKQERNQGDNMKTESIGRLPECNICEHKEGINGCSLTPSQLNKAAVKCQSFHSTRDTEMLSYNFYVFCEMRREMLHTKEKIEHDLLWPAIVKDYREFIESQFNDDNMPMIECIEDFLSHVAVKRQPKYKIFDAKGQRYKEHTFSNAETEYSIKEFFWIKKRGCIGGKHVDFSKFTLESISKAMNIEIVDILSDRFHELILEMPRRNKS